MQFDYKPTPNARVEEDEEGGADGIKTTLKVFAAVIGAVAFGVVLTPALTGYMPVVSQRLVSPGQTYVMEGHGDLGANSRGSLICTYFTGRRFVQRVYWHSRQNLFGKSSCPLFLED